MFKRNLVANYLGYFFTSFAEYIVVPVYLNKLGLSAFGVISICTLAVSISRALDFGATATLANVMSKANLSSEKAFIARKTLRHFECTIGIVIAIVLSLVLSFTVPIATVFFSTTDPVLNPRFPEYLIFICLISSLRLAESLYKSCLIGLEKQVVSNSLSLIPTAIRTYVASIVVLLVSPTLRAFFLVNVVAGILSLCFLVTATYRYLPQSHKSSDEIYSAYSPFGSFSRNAFAIAIIAFFLTQLDKIILIKTLPLSEFGSYSIAVALAAILPAVAGPAVQTFYPRFCTFFASNNQTELVKTYHVSSQLISVLAGSFAFTICFFPVTLVLGWTQNSEIASQISQVLILLVLGSLLNCLMWVPSQIQLAHGWTTLGLKVNFVALLIVAPSTIYVAPRFGTIGVAWIWLLLNSFYIIVNINLMHSRILRGQKLFWYLIDCVLPLGTQLLVGIFLKYLFLPGLIGDVPFIAVPLIIIILAFAGMLAASDLRKVVCNQILRPINSV